MLWYGSASWWSRRPGVDTTPSYLVEYDAGGHELARQMLPPLAFNEPLPAGALASLVTPLAGYIFRCSAAPYLGDDTGWTIGLQRDTFVGFMALMLLSAVVCTVGSFLLARSYTFSRARCIGWSLCGLLFGAAGLLLMLALQQWPARIICPSCRKLRVIDRECCEHCGAQHAPPALDGTEIFESTASVRLAASSPC